MTVKMQLTTAPVSRSLRPMSSCISSSVAPRMSLASLRSAVVAPRRAKRRIGGRHHRTRLAAARSPSTSAGVRRRAAPGGRSPSAQRAEGDAPQLDHRMADGLAHPADLALAPLAQDELERARPEPADARGRGPPVVELDALPQPRAARGR